MDDQVTQEALPNAFESGLHDSIDAFQQEQSDFFDQKEQACIDEIQTLVMDFVRSGKLRPELQREFLADFFMELNAAVTEKQKIHFNAQLAAYLARLRFFEHMDDPSVREDLDKLRAMQDEFSEVEEKYRGYSEAELTDREVADIVNEIEAEFGIDLRGRRDLLTKDVLHILASNLRILRAMPEYRDIFKLIPSIEFVNEAKTSEALKEAAAVSSTDLCIRINLANRACVSFEILRHELTHIKDFIFHLSERDSGTRKEAPTDTEYVKSDKQSETQESSEESEYVKMEIITLQEVLEALELNMTVETERKIFEFLSSLSEEHFTSLMRLIIGDPNLPYGLRSVYEQKDIFSFSVPDHFKIKTKEMFRSERENVKIFLLSYMKYSEMVLKPFDEIVDAQDLHFARTVIFEMQQLIETKGSLRFNFRMTGINSMEKLVFADDFGNISILADFGFQLSDFERLSWEDMLRVAQFVRSVMDKNPPNKKRVLSALGVRPDTVLVKDKILEKNGLLCSEYMDRVLNIDALIGEPLWSHLLEIPGNTLENFVGREGITFATLFDGSALPKFQKIYDEIGETVDSFDVKKKLEYWDRLEKRYGSILKELYEKETFLHLSLRKVQCINNVFGEILSIMKISFSGPIVASLEKSFLSLIFPGQKLHEFQKRLEDAGSSFVFTDFPISMLSEDEKKLCFDALVKIIDKEEYSPHDDQFLNDMNFIDPADQIETVLPSRYIDFEDVFLEEEYLAQGITRPYALHRYPDIFDRILKSLQDAKEFQKFVSPSQEMAIKISLAHFIALFEGTGISKQEISSYSITHFVEKAKTILRDESQNFSLEHVSQFLSDLEVNELKALIKDEILPFVESGNIAEALKKLLDINNPTLSIVRILLDKIMPGVGNSLMKMSVDHMEVGNFEKEILYFLSDFVTHPERCTLSRLRNISQSLYVLDTYIGSTKDYYLEEATTLSEAYYFYDKETHQVVVRPEIIEKYQAYNEIDGKKVYKYRELRARIDEFVRRGYFRAIP